jgi:hypothetical protein
MVNQIFSCVQSFDSLLFCCTQRYFNFQVALFEAQISCGRLFCAVIPFIAVRLKLDDNDLKTYLSTIFKPFN